MAYNTQQHVFLVACRAYAHAIQSGAKSVEIHIGHLEDILAYLDGSDNSTRLVEQPYDDMSNEVIAKLFAPEEDL